MLCDSSASGWPWERLAAALSGLASHVVYYWGVQRDEVPRPIAPLCKLPPLLLPCPLAYVTCAPRRPAPPWVCNASQCRPENPTSTLWP